ncbi:hypothetical protein AVEN_138024-1 [Araneus ventricosus]|uniref:Uncharacterized protein n=1 Tax=Araneus ventricosus TaxID=182803 RepID=A0A4Y2S0N5_ARAVE|nr:hypothetical protein AVEN_138024-1 [Araneus ventricosus]
MKAAVGIFSSNPYQLSTGGGGWSGNASPNTSIILEALSGQYSEKEASNNTGLSKCNSRYAGPWRYRCLRVRFQTWTKARCFLILKLCLAAGTRLRGAGGSTTMDFDCNPYFLCRFAELAGGVPPKTQCTSSMRRLLFTRSASFKYNGGCICL